jgi:hypothetical protein
MELEKLKNIFETYISRGFYLFPIKKETKRPAIKDNLKQASNDINQLMKWNAKFDSPSWGLSCAKSGLVVVDVDVRHGGLESWLALIADKDPINTLTATTGSGGKHYVFRSEDLEKYIGKIQDGIDIKHNGYIVVYPSLNNVGNAYTWDDFKVEVSELPLWLKEIITKDDRTGASSPVYKFGKDYLDKLVLELKKFPLTYEEWVQAGMAIHAADDGPEGLRLYLHLTQNPNFNEGDLDQAREKFRTFNKTNGITAGTLNYLIKKKGGIVPHPRYDSDIKAFQEIRLSSIAEEKKTFEGFYRHGQKLICWHKDAIIDWFNDQGYCYIEANASNAAYAHVTDNPDGTLSVQCLDSRALQQKTESMFYVYEKMTNTDVKIMEEPASRIWREAEDRRKFRKIAYSPSAWKADLNLWTPLEFESGPYDCSVILDFIEKAICDDDTEKFNWLLDFLAHIIQRPAEHTSIVPVLISMQGTGKGLLMDYVMKRILQSRYTVVTTASQLVSQFNESLSKKLLTFVDEATWRGNKTEDGILKRLIGSPTMIVEEKFGARYELENYSRYVIASNNEEAVALEVGNRRYVIIEGSKRLANNLAYFGPIATRIREDETCIQGFHWFLKTRDLKHYDPHAIIKGNTAGQEAKIATLGSVALFWEDVFWCNPREMWGPEGLRCALAYNYYCTFADKIKSYEKAISEKYFWNKTKRMVKDLPEVSRFRLDNNPKGGERVYVRNITPREFITSFCRTLDIKFPEEIFDPQDYLFRKD